MALDENDHRQIRCRMLGHEVPFSYSRTCGTDFPCRRIFDCWYEYFDIASYVREHFSSEEVEKLLEPPKDKAVSLYELILKAQQLTQKPPRD